ncbi:MAG: single-stranded DNA-binding protein [Clostridiales Family XIII bacterium]|jgi:single-strand DNA-binding protein|nr:single-stranded DNA-binding protein [Clostridiales Family XIII bacterium]
MNIVILVGNLTADPEKSMTGSGMTVARIRIAVNRSRRNEGQPDADFFRVTVFDKQAENVLRYLTKGSKVGIEGRIQNSNYTKDGKTVYQDDIIANRVEFLSPKGSREGAGGGSYGGQFESRPADDFAPLPPSGAAQAPAAPQGGGGSLPTGFAELDDDDDMPF